MIFATFEQGQVAFNEGIGLKPDEKTLYLESSCGKGCDLYRRDLEISPPEAGGIRW